MWNETSEKQAQDEANRQIDEAIEHAEKLSRPTIETLFTDVYEQMPWNLEEQLRQLKTEKEGGTQ